MLEMIMRTQSAITMLPFMESQKEEVLKAWLKQMLYPQNPNTNNPNIDISATIDTQQITCWAKNETSSLSAQMLDFMQQGPFKDSEVQVFQKALKTFSNGELSTWLQLADRGQETGWVYKGVFPLKSTFAFIPKGSTKQALEDWFNAYDIDSCIKIGRSISGNRFTFFNVELFGDSLDQDISLYTDLMDEIKLPPLPEAILELILDDNPSSLEVSFSIDSRGILKTGLVIPSPSSDFVRKLSLVFGIEAFDNLAALEGSLGKEAPKTVEINRTGSGIQVELMY